MEQPLLILILTMGKVCISDDLEELTSILVDGFITPIPFSIYFQIDIIKKIGKLMKICLNVARTAETFEFIDPEIFKMYLADLALEISIKSESIIRKEPDVKITGLSCVKRRKLLSCFYRRYIKIGQDMNNILAYFDKHRKIS